MPEPLLSVDALTVHRGKTRVLHECSLTIEPGGPYAIVGESGSGKTTLLLAVMGLLPVSDGKIQLAGQDLAALDARQRARLAGLVFQDYQLFPHLTVLDNATLAPRLAGQSPEKVEASVRESLADLRIADLAGRYPHELSGGQKQRAAIARSMALSPQLLFFDEPSAALDLRTTEELADLLQRLNATSQVIVVSHDWPFIERCCARGAVMENGRVSRVGAVSNLRG